MGACCSTDEFVMAKAGGVPKEVPRTTLERREGAMYYIVFMRLSVSVTEVAMLP